VFGPQTRRLHGPSQSTMRPSMANSSASKMPMAAVKKVMAAM
jgi:hypothetical protein